MKRYQIFINGKFVSHSSSRMISVVNPATEQVISEVPAGTAADVELAVTAAEAAQGAWAKLPAIERAGYLREIAQGIRKHGPDLARTISEEQGKILPLAQREVANAADYFDYMAEFARRYEGEIIQSDRPNEAHLPVQTSDRCDGRNLALELPLFPDRPQDGARVGHRQYHRHQTEL